MPSYNCYKLFNSHIPKHMAEPAVGLLKVINIQQEKGIHGNLIFDKTFPMHLSAAVLV